MEVAVIILIIFLIVNLFLSREFRFVASEKGYDSPKYFWYTFLFGIYGMLLVIALPNNANKVNFAKKTSLNSNTDISKIAMYDNSEGK